MPLSSVPLSYRTGVAAVAVGVVVAIGVAVTVSGCAGASGDRGAVRADGEVAPAAAAVTSGPAAPSTAVAAPSPSTAVAGDASASTVSARATPVPAASGQDTPTVRAVSATSRASAVLHRWDRARAAAFAAGDVAGLQRLYVPGSAAGRRDVRALRAYLARGLRVEGMRMQLLAVQVLQERTRRLRLRVTDRLTGAVAVGPQGRVRLPTDTASTRVVTLVRRGGGWRVAAVSAPGST